MTTEEVIHEAGQKLVTVRFDYTEQDGSNEGAREVEPYSYRVKGKQKLFYGFDIGKNDTRSFYLLNMHNIEITNNKYVPRWEVEV